MRLFATLIDVYSVIVLLAVVMSWLRLGPRNPVATTLYSLTEPVLEPIRRVRKVGGLDFSPMVLLIVLRLMRSLV
ncbi:MAG: YggT family protein [Acidobacteria bacterium]|nr:MAG: YggT family protein [Acidobacteriota bacterium]